jgi:hypothetical protein
VSVSQSRATSILGENAGYGRLLFYALPLAVSGLVMNLEQPVVAAAVARLPNPDIGLAAFGVAVSIAVWSEAPILMLLDAATARCVDRTSYRLIRRYTLTLCGLLLLMMLAIAFTPLHDLLIGGLLGVSDRIAPGAVSALAFFVIWAPMVGWRRIHQAILIRHGRTRIVGYGVGARLTTVVTVALLGFRFGAGNGPALGAAAMATGVTVEALIAYLCARQVIRTELPASNPLEDGVRSIRSFNRYYLPLAASAFFYFVANPLITAGLSRAANPAVSLAIWPVAFSLVSTVGSPLVGMQQVAVRLGTEPASAALTRRALLGAGIVLAGLLVTANLLGLTGFVLSRGIGLSDDLRPAAERAIWIISPLPALIAIRSLERGTLIRLGSTLSVQSAAGAGLCLLVALLLLGARFAPLNGYSLAATAMLAGTTLEAGLLTVRVRRRLGHVLASTAAG